ncbi:Transcriptional regulator [Fructobacillus cardui]|jgi:transcriptional regulator with XRE-family HTH domain|uniref:Contains XRE-family HTH domain (HipB) n=1 Tax=Fructobacillus tropaeoli TaxID=709323 RepID=A0ABN9YXM1_9LACO|nr:Transcriptional regulator [Fructobacillus tropaeoli]CAK1249398.1 Transcriptional regulator [Fructobacillus cardui]
MANRLKELRKEKGYTLNDIAKATGITRGTYNNYENEKTEPKLATWQKLADFFGVSVSHLQGLDTYSNEGIGLLIDYLMTLKQVNNQPNTPTIDGLIIMVKLLSYGDKETVQSMNNLFTYFNYLDPDNPDIDLIVSEQEKENFDYKYLSTGGFSSTEELKDETKERASVFIDELAKLQKSKLTSS